MYSKVKLKEMKWHIASLFERTNWARRQFESVENVDTKRGIINYVGENTQLTQIVGIRVGWVRLASEQKFSLDYIVKEAIGSSMASEVARVYMGSGTPPQLQTHILWFNRGFRAQEHNTRRPFIITNFIIPL